MIRLTHILGLTALIAVSPIALNTVQAAEEPVSPVYQIIKATQDRVWRLNRRTGEIAVCSINGENLLCTNSADAIKPPTKTYAELEAERKQAAADTRQRRETERKRDLAFVNKMIDALKEVVRVASEREADTTNP